MRPLAFEKYEGLGNDFVLVEAAHEDDVGGDLARAVCDRRLGVGADGVLLLLPARGQGADARMRVINADGSVPEMCGNGLRCLALHVARARGAASVALSVETDGGVRRCEVDDARGLAKVNVEMGVVRWTEDVTVDVGGEAVAFSLADAGNPHAIAFRSRADLARIGPIVATHARFARGTNVELVEVAKDGIDVAVWERGVGPTLACGTGACAVVAVACAKGLANRGQSVRVRLPGGGLDVTIDARDHATMRGPARHVFRGSYLDAGRGT